MTIQSFIILIAISNLTRIAIMLIYHQIQKQIFFIKIKMAV